MSKPMPTQSKNSIYTECQNIVLYNIHEYMDQKLEYLKSNELLYYSDNKISLTLRNYKVKYKYKDNLEIIITGIIDRVVINEDVDVTKYMTDVVTKYIIDISDEVKQDFLNLEYHSSIYKKDYTLDAIVLNIKIKTVD
jgi:hypothetical protein